MSIHHPDPLEPPPPGGRPRLGKHGGIAESSRDDIFFAAIETTRMPMVITDPKLPDNPIVFVNQAFLNMTGYRADEIVGKNCRFLQGPETSKETVDDIREAIAANREIATEILNYRKDGDSFWNALFISPVLDHKGNVIYLFASQLDVSRRRDAEDALRQAQKMEALGQLTGGIAHDFNNLLQVMNGYADMAKFAAKSASVSSDRLDSSLDRIKEAVAKAGTLTAQLLAFARKQRLEGRVINLNDTLHGMADMARRTLGHDIVLREDFAKGLHNCRVDPTQTEVAFLNLLVNARHAMPDGGTVTVATRNVRIDERDTQMFAPLPAGDYAMFSVTDSGSGIPPDIIDRVMEPFFTTKEEGEGTGLGLSMVYGFAKQSQGAARIYSEIGIGTTVSLYFPAADQKTTDAAPITRNPDAKGNEHILVVDDRPEVAELAGAMLETLGYSVEICNGAAEALVTLRSGTHFDMIFTDLIMPGRMNGIVLAREARRAQPRIKVLLTTGYADASLERSDSSGSEFETLYKPYGQAELAKRVRQVLDGPTGVG